jgi:DegV family protein with EDD domain
MIQVVADSGINLQPELLQAYEIVTVPLLINIDGVTYREGIDIQSEEFYRRLPQTDPLPTTSQPPPADFAQVYQPLLAAGHEIVAITISSKLSGTYNSAVQACKVAEGEQLISVVDSLSAAAGQGMMAIAASEAARAGLSRVEVVRVIERMRQEMLLVLTLDTLEYLRRGGRIGGAAAFMGGLLRIKPVVLIKYGKVEPGDRARNRRRAIERLIEMEQDRFGNRPVWLAAMHITAEEEMRAMAEEAQQALNVTRVFFAEVGPVIGAHIGPNALGLCAVPEPSF